MAAQPRPSRGWSDCGAVFFLSGVIWVLLFGYSRRDSPVGWRRLRPSGYFVAVVAQPDDIRQELQRSHCSRKLWMRVFRPLPTRRRSQRRAWRERLRSVFSACAHFVIVAVPRRDSPGGSPHFLGRNQIGSTLGAFLLDPSSMLLLLPQEQYPHAIPRKACATEGAHVGAVNRPRALVVGCLISWAFTDLQVRRRDFAHRDHGHVSIDSGTGVFVASRTEHDFIATVDSDHAAW